jgi:hypothetical protein
MRASMLATTAVLAVLTVPGRPAMALTEAQVRRACIAAIAGEGLRTYRLSAPEITRTREGGSFTGQLSRGADRRDFTCVLDARGNVTELTVEPPAPR